MSLESFAQCVYERGREGMRDGGGGEEEDEGWRGRRKEGGKNITVL